MNIKPEITLSSLDVDRIYDLIESLPRNAASTDQLEAELERGVIVAPEQLPPNVVTMNSRVRFIIEATQKQFEMTLVYPKDMDTNGGKISILAPIGSALLGLSVGDTIQWPKPDGLNVDVTIQEITYQPEREGEYSL
ncbi:nucleoside diphosphate kinase regulator [Vibrio panuliri]|uniref:Nucleoside diphosphate kinase regulator n=1 Tax=Vibrio panuliri TaxID=1381081 RepID=A0ABX3F7B0_9VIBR|nr:nucleoside diphosphate kinase regulator [Vibrio panuliri]KAB1454273.1 nucleoside diphosphate kinase regulator [Vibrio panuliri]OLQ86494.1 nucleoside diphosphate kinase regulator [Vibrio panuliri]